MASIDQQFVEYIVKTLVNNPDKVELTRTIDERGVLLSLAVDPEDVGRVIGRRGATAQAIRVLLRALGTKQGARFNLKIVNTDENLERGQDVELGAERAAEAAVGEVDAGEDTETDSSEDFDNDAPDTEEPTSELAEKTRAELAGYDDLDI